MNPSDIRAFADWLEEHPGIIKHTTSINSYQTTPEDARRIFGEGAEIVEIAGQDTIADLVLRFGALEICFVTKKGILFQPALDGETIIWKLRPEFTKD